MKIKKIKINKLRSKMFDVEILRYEILTPYDGLSSRKAYIYEQLTPREASVYLDRKIRREGIAELLLRLN